jgi:hypothetical protein
MPFGSLVDAVENSGFKPPITPKFDLKGKFTAQLETIDNFPTE